MFAETEFVTLFNFTLSSQRRHFFLYVNTCKPVDTRLCDNVVRRLYDVVTL